MKRDRCENEHPNQGGYNFDGGHESGVTPGMRLKLTPPRRPR